MHSVVVKSHHLAHALRVRVEIRVPHKPPDCCGDFSLVFGDVQEDQTIPGMPQARLPKISVSSKESRALQTVQHRQDVLIADAEAGDLGPDLPHCDSPLTQPPDLDLGDVLVYD